jgi:hypothetical protein
LILITVLFQFGTKHWHTIAYIAITLCLVGTLFVTIFVPESAEFLHSKQKYEESRQVLTKVAHFNSVYYLKDEPYESYSFTQEVSSLDFHTQSIRRRAESDDSSDVSDLVEANRLQLKEEFIQV